MRVNEIIQGDCIEVIKTFPDKSINCVITSPPYWQLRDYGWTGQWGLEPTYQEYLEHLWSLMDEIKRVLTDDGTVFVNLGDSYSKRFGNSGGYSDKSTLVGFTRPDTKGREMEGKIKERVDCNAPDKCLLLIPHRFAIGCIDRGWIVRNDIIWAKRNGMPESVTDRFAKKHEYFFFMVKSEKYYFDLDGVRDRHISNMVRDRNSTFKKQKEIGATMCSRDNDGMQQIGSPLGKNPGSVSDFWDIPTQPSSEKHYATFNTKLIDKPIISGCPKDGIILDPFCGTGTTLFRAHDLGRRFIGIEGNPEYVAIANKRIESLKMQPKLF